MTACGSWGIVPDRRRTRRSAVRPDGHRLRRPASPRPPSKSRSAAASPSSTTTACRTTWARIRIRATRTAPSSTKSGCWSPVRTGPAAIWSRPATAACTTTCDRSSVAPRPITIRWTPGTWAVGRGLDRSRAILPAATSLRLSRARGRTKTVSRLENPSLRRPQLAQTRALAGFPHSILELVRYLHSREPCPDIPIPSSPWAHWLRCPPDRVSAAPESPRPTAPPASAPEAALAPRAISRPSVPLRFEPLAPSDNGSRVFVARSAGYAVHVGPTWVEVHATDCPDAARRGHGPDGHAVRRRRRRSPRGQPRRGAGAGPLPDGRRPRRWQVGLEARGRVRFRDVYPGVDVAYYGSDREIEYDILVVAARRPRAGPAAALGRRPRRHRRRRRPRARRRAGAGSRPRAGRLSARRAGRIPVASRYVVDADGRSASRSATTTAARRWSSIRSSATRCCSAARASTRPCRWRSMPPATSISPARRRRRTSPARPAAETARRVRDQARSPRGRRCSISATSAATGVDEARGLAIDTLGNAYVVGRRRRRTTSRP